MEESEKKDYFHSFMRTVETDLKKHKNSYVFTQEQLAKVREKFNVDVIGDDGCCIYISLKKGKNKNAKL